MSDRMTELRDEFNPKRLNVLAALREAYSGAWNNLGEMLRLIWLPCALWVALSIVAALIDARDLPVLQFLVETATLFLWPIIAVAWHRFILVGDAAPGKVHLRFGRREGRFLLVSFFLLLLFMPGFIITMGTTEFSDPAAGPTGSLIGFVGLLLLMVGIYYFVRLSLLLPAVAVAVDEPMNARLILERTRNNFWRLVALILLTGLPIAIFFWLVAWVAAALGLPAIVPLIVYAVVYVFFAIVNVAILSVAYRELIGPPGTLANDMDHPETM
ncbi:MAG TPA: hypothetical protein VF449_07520 [Parvibaculum sp.]